MRQDQEQDWELFDQELEPMGDDIAHEDDVDNSSVPTSKVIQQALGLGVTDPVTDQDTGGEKILFALMRWGGFKAVGHWRTFGS